MKMLNRFVALGLLVSLSVVGFGAARASVAAKGLSNPVFFARPKGSPGPAIAYDLVTGAQRFDFPTGILSADGMTFAAADGTYIPGTTLSLFDAHSGSQTLAMPLSGKWWLNAVSPDAHFAALTRTPSGQEKQTWTKNGTWQTDLQIIDTQTRQVKHTLKLDGNFDAEALSQSGTSLFMIEHLPAAKPDHYAIRWYDLAREQLIADPLRSKTADEIMSGYAWGGTATPDGEWLFTLYVSTNRKVAFVHMLNTKSAYTVCVDLPSTSAAGHGSSDGDFEALKRYALAYSPGKHILYAANAQLGIVAEIGLDSYRYNDATSKLEANKVVNFKPIPNERFYSPSYPVPAAALARDSSRLFFADGGLAYTYDTAHGTVDRTFSADSAITGLGLRDDNQLVVAQWNLNTVKTFDIASGRTLFPPEVKAAYPVAKPTGLVPPSLKLAKNNAFWYGP